MNSNIVRSQPSRNPPIWKPKGMNRGNVLRSQPLKKPFWTRKVMIIFAVGTLCVAGLIIGLVLGLKKKKGGPSSGPSGGGGGGGGSSDKLDVHEQVAGKCVYGKSQTGYPTKLDMRKAGTDQIFSCPLTVGNVHYNGRCRKIPGGYESIFDYMSRNVNSYYHPRHADYISFPKEGENHLMHQVYYTSPLRKSDGTLEYTLSNKKWIMLRWFSDNW